MLKKKLSSSLKKASKQQRKLQEPLWKGPEEDGVTQSMLNTFLICRERFRIKYVLGLQAADTFNHRPEYGSMWHVCEEAVCKEHAGPGDEQIALRKYAKELCKRYPLQQEQINHWYQVCKIQFPIYVEYYKTQKPRKKITSLMQEQTFNVPYALPSGRVVKLRGKWDGVTLEGSGRNAGIYLDEHKTKGDIKEDQMRRQLMFDLQTMLYLVALEIQLNQPDEAFVGDEWQNPLKGIRYNVVRRPLSGGKGSIKQLKPTTKNPQGESAEHYYARLGGIIAEDPSHYFMRWKVEVTPVDLERYKREFLNPILEQLCDWYEWILQAKDPFKIMQPDGMGIHFRTPFGIYNIIAEGGASEVDEYLATGSTVGLERADRLFKELK